MAADDHNALLLFRVGPVCCCAPSRPVAGVVIPPAHLHRPPGSDTLHPGVFRHGGHLVKVVDLRHGFGAPAAGPGRVIVTALDGGHTGFLVDDIIDILEWPREGWGNLPPPIPRQWFRRTLLHEGRICLYTEFDRLAGMEGGGILREYLGSLETDEATADTTPASARPATPTSPPPPAEDRAAHTGIMPDGGQSSTTTAPPPAAAPTPQRPAPVRPPTADTPSTRGSATTPRHETAMKPAPAPVSRTPPAPRQPASRPANRETTRPAAADTRAAPPPATRPAPQPTAPSPAGGKSVRPQALSAQAHPPPPPPESVAPSTAPESGSGAGLLLALVLIAALGTGAWFALDAWLAPAPMPPIPRMALAPVPDEPPAEPAPEPETPDPEPLPPTPPREPPQPPSPQTGYRAEIREDAAGITILLHQPAEKPADDATETASPPEPAPLADTPARVAPAPATDTPGQPPPAADTTTRREAASTAGNTTEPAPPAPATEPPAAPPREIVHIVVRGDTLWDIAARYVHDPFRYPELARLSRIRNPDLIYPGDRVRIIVVRD